MKHKEQGRYDDVAIMWAGDNMIGAGYKCSACGEAVFPLGVLLPESLLTEKQKFFLKVSEGECLGNRAIRNGMRIIQITTKEE